MISRALAPDRPVIIRLTEADPQLGKREDEEWVLSITSVGEKEGDRKLHGSPIVTREMPNRETRGNGRPYNSR